MGVLYGGEVGGKDAGKEVVSELKHKDRGVQFIDVRES